jgi:hypothetical protein
VSSKEGDKNQLSSLQSVTHNMCVTKTQVVCNVTAPRSPLHHLNDLVERRDVPVHAEHAVGGDELGSGSDVFG